ncbi:isocitrate lyase/phosphoenolpyruvate mutase family protein [Micromonospora sp. NPDC049559]|uniref:isocitrate lyase/PEP mutase family protein n=1 Tax=Micromonospora sp. NPDC049559 TaxID=3155923 RepID=UPI00343AD541
MSVRSDIGRAGVLRALHRPGDPLVLPNAWDAGTARAVEAAGFPAVATSSAAVAESLGYADGEATPPGEMLAAVARVARAVAVPVTADLERGYGMAPTELVERLAATGAVGCNLEDSDPRTGELVDPQEQADFLAAVRAAADDAGVDLVLNARVDVYLAGGTGDPTERLAEAVRRARRYAAAGADCVYPIGATGPDDLRALVRDAGAPVNVLFRPGAPSLPQLAEFGVARVSFGGGLYRAARADHGRMLDAVRAGRDPYRP